MANDPVILISSTSALRDGVPDGAQFIYGAPRYTVTTNEVDDGEGGTRTVTSAVPTGEHDFYFVLRTSLDLTNLKSQLRRINAQDTEGFDEATTDMVRQILSK